VLFATLAHGARPIGPAPHRAGPNGPGPFGEWSIALGGVWPGAFSCASQLHCQARKRKQARQARLESCVHAHSVCL